MDMECDNISFSKTEYQKRYHLLGLTFAVIMVTVLSVDAAASDWFVRPAGGSYGSEDGSSYQDAWDGLPNVVWGAGGVVAGDTLYVCGFHLRTRTGGAAFEYFTPGANGTEGNVITVRGDYPGDPGIVWGAGVMAHEAWVNEGSNTWSITFMGAANSEWYFEDITADSWTVLDRVLSVEECKATPGTYYCSDYQLGSKFYVHCTDDGGPTNRIAANHLGYHVGMLNGNHYITWLNLKFYNIFRWVKLDGVTGFNYVSNIRWEGCTNWYGGTALFFFRNYHNNIEFINCDLAWARNGICTSEYPWDGNGPHHFTIRGCTIHDMGVKYGDADAHGISGNGLNDATIENNEIYNCGSGITFYEFTNNTSMTTVIVRWNYIHDMHTLPDSQGRYANSRGIEYNCTGDNDSDKSGNKCYGNIVANVDDAGYRYTWAEYEVDFYNNIAYNCGVSFYLSHSIQDIGPNIKLRNNISLYPGEKHINFGTDVEGNYVIDSDYNVFFPIAEDNFFIYTPEAWGLVHRTNMSFSEWQALSIPGSTFDTHSIVADPLFVDPENGDFRLQAGSPAIDVGIDVGSTQGYGGNAIPQGSAPDIGAYEYTLSAIADLAISGTSQNSVTFAWTVPVDDGLAGKPGRYDIRYATTPLTDVNYDTATQVQGEPVAGDFGDAQSFTITDLNPGTTYYIAIKTSNDTGSTTSPLSNVISGTTAAIGNSAPVLAPIGDKSIEEEEPLAFVISATDADAGDTLIYSATNTPTGANWVPATRTFTWTPTISQSDTYYVTFEVTDNQVTVAETITITVTEVQSALTISSTSGGSTSPVEGIHSYDEGTVVSIQAAVIANYHFVNWTGTAVDAGKVANANAASTTVTADADYTIQANFAIDQYTLTISSTSGGSVSNPGEGSIDYDYGTDVSIQVTAGGGNYFVNWAGTAVTAGKVTNPNAAGTTVTVDADYTLGANFGEQDGVAPTVTNCSPAADSIQAPLNSLIIVNVSDTLGVAAGSVEITLDGDTMYTGDTTEYISATGICRRAGTPTDFTYAYQSSQPFDFDEIKTLTVDAADVGGVVMTQESYSFTTEMRSFGQNKQANSGLDNLNSSRPATVCDTDGNIWAVWHAGPGGSRNVYVAKLAAGADNFGASVQIRSNSSDQACPAIALGTDDKLYVVWQDNRQADDNNQGQWDIYVSTSVDGTSWSAERRVNDPNEGSQIYPAIVVDGQSPNRAHVVWQDGRAGNQDICIATWRNGFMNQTVSQPITSDTSNQTTPAIAVDSSNTVYVLWTDARNATKDIYGAAGSPWTNVPVVTKAADQSSPAIAVESTGSVLHMLWVDNTPGDSDIYYASSNGLPGSPLTGSSLMDPGETAEQLSPSIAVTGSAGNGLEVFAGWHDERNADTKIQGWIDSFHTGFNLQAIRYILDSGLAPEYRAAYGKGVEYYAGNFFLEDGTPKYYHDRIYPIDIHSPAQAICFFCREGKEYQDLTDRIVNWMLQNMYSRKGFFYFRKGKSLTNRIPYMRWSQAWAFHALTEYMDS